MLLRRASLAYCYLSSARCYSASSSKPSSLAELFAKPSWSTSTLLRSNEATTEDETITEQQLAHLYKLSALQLPSDPAERLARRRELATQLHFVRLVHEVDTTGVEPLRNLLASQHRFEENGGVLRYEDALAYGETAKERFKQEDASASNPAATDKIDYLKLAKRKRGRFYTVSGGLVNEPEF